MNGREPQVSQEGGGNSADDDGYTLAKSQQLVKTKLSQGHGQKLHQIPKESH